MKSAGERRPRSIEGREGSGDIILLLITVKCKGAPGVEVPFGLFCKSCAVLFVLLHL